MRHILNWIAEWFGSHVCHEFTQWQTHEQDVKKTVRYANYGNLEDKTYIMTRKWQERRCTLCGRTYQEELKFF